MKMKRNTLTLALVLVLGLSLFTAATVAASSSNVGYESFKDTMKDLNHEGASNAQITMTLVDNGETIVSVDADMVGEKAGDNFSGTLALSDSDTDKSFQVYGQEGQVYLIDLLEGHYYQMDHSEDRHGSDEDYDHKDHQMTGVEEELLDYFVGDLKDNFLVETMDDGSQTLTFTMEESEVPTGLNLMIKAATSAENRTEDKRGDMTEKMPFMEGFDHEAAPNLTDDVQLNYVKVTIQVDADRQVTGLTGMTEISGLDSDGVSHELQMSFEAVVGYDSVTPATIDADAYEWEVIETPERSEESSRKNRRR